eukprot:5291551-Pyramimonas_sp.AAC.2
MLLCLAPSTCLAPGPSEDSPGRLFLAHPPDSPSDKQSSCCAQTPLTSGAPARLYRLDHVIAAFVSLLSSQYRNCTPQSVLSARARAARARTRIFSCWAAVNLRRRARASSVDANRRSLRRSRWHHAADDSKSIIMSATLPEPVWLFRAGRLAAGTHGRGPPKAFRPDFAPGPHNEPDPAFMHSLRSEHHAGRRSRVFLIYISKYENAFFPSRTPHVLPRSMHKSFLVFVFNPLLPPMRFTRDLTLFNFPAAKDFCSFLLLFAACLLNARVNN